MNQFDRLIQIAASAAADAALSLPDDFHIHLLNREIRALLKAKFPATDFYIASADGFDSAHGEHPPMIELHWNDEPARDVLDRTLDPLIERRRKDFHFETIVAHSFSCRVCGGTHVGTLADQPVQCTGSGGFPW